MLQHPQKNVIHLLLIVTVAVCLLTGGSMGNPNDKVPTDGLRVSVYNFLGKWLIEHDIDAAMAFISPTPALGSCVRSLDTVGIKDLTPTQSRQTLRWIFEKVAEMSPHSDRLGAIIESLGITPDMGNNITPNEPYELFSLAHGYKDADFICKFDENPAFRKSFYRPDVYYLLFRIKIPERDDFSLVLAWRQEGSQWLIFSLGPLDD